MSDGATFETGLIPVEVWKQLPAIEVFRKMIAGELPGPPIAKHFDYTLSEIDHGRAVFTGRPNEHFYNPLGTIHGGFIATLLDSAMACAVHSTLPAGKGTTSVELKINFIRPVFGKTGALHAVGEVINAGRQIGVAEGKLVDDEGKIYAHGTTTCMNFDLS